MWQIFEQGGEWPEEEITGRLEKEFEQQTRRTRLLRLEAHRDEYNKRLLMHGGLQQTNQCCLSRACLSFGDGAARDRSQVYEHTACSADSPGHRAVG